MGAVNYSSPKSFEDMEEAEAIQEVENVVDVNSTGVCEEPISEVVSAETDRNEATV